MGLLNRDTRQVTIYFMSILVGIEHFAVVPGRLEAMAAAVESPVTVSLAFPVGGDHQAHPAIHCSHRMGHYDMPHDNGVRGIVVYTSIIRGTY